MDPHPGWSPADQSPAPGWFPDPQDPSRLRYWDGEVWTASVAPAQPTAFAYAPSSGQTNGMAIASLVCSIVGPVMCGVPAVLGIIFGHVARSQIKRSEGRETGDGLALAGLIVGYIVVALVIGVFVLAANS